MRVRTHLLNLLIVGCGALLIASPAIAQQPETKKVENAATRSRGTGTDENIKVARGANTPGATAAAPAAKGGARTRGGVSIVHLDNWTSWYVDLYVNGAYCASSGPWGDAYCYVPSGTVVLYGKASFTDGSSLSWGPRSVYVDGALDWKITP
jgi:hypothetical protein